MNVLLINPPFSRLRGTKEATESLGPLWPSCLGSVLKADGFHVSVHDANLDPSTRMSRINSAGKMLGIYKSYSENLKNPGLPVWLETRRILQQKKPDIVGISALSPTRGAAYVIGRLCREELPAAKIIFGGYHPSSFPEEPFAGGAADAVVRGEGEDTFLDLARRIRDGISPDGAAGVTYRDAGSILHNPDRPLIEDLDSLPSGAEFIRTASSGKAPAQYGRGCPFACRFCSDSVLWRRRVRYRSAEKMVSVIEEIIKLHGAREFSFVDGTFNASHKKTRELCELLISKRVRILWDALVRAEGLDDETLRLYHRAGCSQLNVGVESGSPRILKEVKKNTTVEAAAEAIRKIRKNGIAAVSFFCIGLPPETTEDLLATKNAILSLKHNYVIMHIFTPLPGSYYFDRLRESGRLPESHNFDEFGYRSDTNCFTENIGREEFERLRDDLCAAVDSVNRRGGLVSRLLFGNMGFYLRFPSGLIRRALSRLGF